MVSTQQQQSANANYNNNVCVQNMTHYFVFIEFNVKRFSIFVRLIESAFIFIEGLLFLAHSINAMIS